MEEKKKSVVDGDKEIVFSKAIKAGKRIYYLDVKKARNEDLYLCITESKRKQTGEAEPPQFEKHKVFLYKEDFEKFMDGMNDVINYIKQCKKDEGQEEFLSEDNSSEGDSDEIKLDIDF